MSDPNELSKEELLAAQEGAVDTTRIVIEGSEGAVVRHLSHVELAKRLTSLPPQETENGIVDLIVARSAPGERHLPQTAQLTVDGGLEGDRWVNEKYGPEYQMATTQTDYARVVANDQSLELHGDNLFLSLDLSSENLPIGSRLRLGTATVEVTPKAHNGCKKWVQRFGLAPMQLNMTPEWQEKHLRGIYLRVVEPGEVSVGDSVQVLHRPSS